MHRKEHQPFPGTILDPLSVTGYCHCDCSTLKGYKAGYGIVPVPFI